MSFPEAAEAVCPVCGRRSTVLCYRSVNATFDPALKEGLLDGTLNLLECGCGRNTPVVTDLLFHDMEEKYQVFLIHPGEDGVIDVNGIALKLGATLPGYKLRIVRSRNSLVEKILLFDSGLDDRAIEVMKLLMTPTLSRESGSPVTELRSTGIVSGSGAERLLGFLVFHGDSHDADELALPVEEHYHPLLESLHHYCAERMSAASGWQLVEAGYAQLLLETVQAAESGKGAQRFTHNEAAPLSAAVGKEAPRPTGPTGVRGWLLVLCLSLTILGPILNLGALRIAAESYAPYIASYPTLGTMSRLSSMVSGLFIVHSFLIGILLWSRQLKAVKAAKLFFVLTPAYALTSALLPLAAGLPPAADSAVIEGAAQSVIRSGLWSTLWYAYLVRSRRVKATYPQQQSV